MVQLGIWIEQRGGFLVIRYHGAENPTTTEPEKEEVKAIVAFLQERIAKAGGDGKFVENIRDLPDFPDFGQPGEGGIAHGNDN